MDQLAKQDLADFCHHDFRNFRANHLSDHTIDAVARRLLQHQTTHPELVRELVGEAVPQDIVEGWRTNGEYFWFIQPYLNLLKATLETQMK